MHYIASSCSEVKGLERKSFLICYIGYYLHLFFLLQLKKIKQTCLETKKISLVKHSTPPAH